MKRIQSDCLAQTVLFETREDLEKYIAGLQKKHVKYRIENESAKGNGSVLIKIKRQYNNYACLRRLFGVAQWAAEDRGLHGALPCQRRLSKSTANRGCSASFQGISKVDKSKTLVWNAFK